MTKGIYSYLSDMAEFVKKRDVAALEQHFKLCAVELAGSDQTMRISLVSIDDYEAALRLALSEAIITGKKEKAKETRNKSISTGLSA